MIGQSMSEPSSRKRERTSSSGSSPTTRQAPSPEEEDGGTTDWEASHHEIQGKLEEETKKNTELNLQLMFVRSECVRLMGLQEVMTKSITKLQVSYRTPSLLCYIACSFL